MAARKSKKSPEALKPETGKAKGETLETKKAAPKRARKAGPKKEAFDPNNYIMIDHPQENEIISGLHYAIRIGASDNGAAEISFDDGDWQPCRQAAGYWWFDWGYFTPGTHTIVARLRDAEGNTLKKTKAVRVEVV